jgi:hypothetical protein
MNISLRFIKTSGKLLLLFTIISLLLPAKLYSQITGTDDTIGGRYDYPASNGKPMLDIRMQASGGFRIYRKVSDTYVTQLFGISGSSGVNPACIFAIKIDGTVFSSYSLGGPVVRLTSSDVGTRIIGQAEPVEQVTKRYSPPSTYTGAPFYVDITFWYGKNNPDYFTITADIHAEDLPATANISLAYGFDTYVNGDDYSVAITFPDLGYNGSNNSTPQTYATAQVQSLYMVGCINNTAPGSLMAFFTMGGRSFDRAYSGPYDNPANVNPYGYINYTANAGYFRYSRVDNGIAVAYDNIPGHALTTISTGLTFTSNIPAGLTYALQQGASFSTTPSQHITVPMDAIQATPVNLRLGAKNDHSEGITNVGFQVNIPTFPTGLTITGDQTSQDFTATHDHTTTSYTATGGTIAASTTADILVPLSAAGYGEWIIDHSNFSNMSNIMPMGSAPDTITVTTTAGFSSTAAAGVPAGSSKEFTIKLPDGLTAHKDTKIYLTHSGATSSFSSIPTYVTIPEGENSTPLTVIAQSTATNGDAVTITLDSTDYGAIIIDADNDEVTLTVANIHYIPVNPHLMSKMILVP